MTSPSDVWVIGEYTAAGHIRAFSMHWNGTSWTFHPIPVPDADFADYGAWAIGRSPAGELWAAGHREFAPSSIPYSYFGTHNAVWKWDGTAWQLMATPELGGGSGDAIWGMAALGANDVWFVGDGHPEYPQRALAMHWNGSQFMLTNVPVVNPESGREAGNPLNDISALASNDIWAVGGTDETAIGRADYSQIQHWDGTRWTHVPGPTPGTYNELFTVAAVSPTNVWAAGEYWTTSGVLPLLIQWDGTSWSEQPAPGGFRDMVALAADDIWAVGGDAVYHYDGTTWSIAATFPGALFTSAAPASGCEVWATGQTPPDAVVVRGGSGPTTAPVPSPLPAEWAAEDVGGVSAAGQSTAAAGVFTVEGAGADVWGTADAFHFAYRTLTGDGQIVARVASLRNVHAWTKAGVMIRESLGAGSAHAFMLVSPGKGSAFQRRVTTNGTSASTAGPFVAAPYWVKLARSGDTISAYVSSNGSTWALVGSDSIPMGATVYAGLAVSSHVAGTLATGTFDNVSVTAGASVNRPPAVALMEPAQAATLTTLSATTLTASAADPDGSIAHVRFYAGTALIGTDATSPYGVVWYPQRGIHQLTAVATDNAGASTTSAPIQVTVQTAVGPGWWSMDVGATGAAGDASVGTGWATVYGAGSDIWGTADAFHFAYQPLDGDGEIVARIVRMDNVNAWTKAGVMIRESLDAGSPHALMLLSPGKGTAFQRRATANGVTTSTAGPLVTPSYWLRLVRSGSTLRAFASANGTSWTAVGSDTIAMGSKAYVGLAVSSHVSGVLATATFDNVAVTRSAATPPATASTDEVLLYAAEAATVVGNWQVTADSTAATGVRLQNPNAGLAKVGTAVVDPADYFEMTFDADAGKPYRLWIRGKAQSNTYANDSVHVQFSDSVDGSGAAAFRIRSTQSAVVNLEDCSGCSISGWGWQDNGYGAGVLGPVVYFATSGTHTIRIQNREDGLGIDQIVLSAVKYVGSAPGALKNDTTILSK